MFRSRLESRNLTYIDDSEDSRRMPNRHATTQFVQTLGTILFRRRLSDARLPRDQLTRDTNVVSASCQWPDSRCDSSSCSSCAARAAAATRLASSCIKEWFSAFSSVDI